MVFTFMFLVTLGWKIASSLILRNSGSFWHRKERGFSRLVSGTKGLGLVSKKRSGAAEGRECAALRVCMDTCGVMRWEGHNMPRTKQSWLGLCIILHESSGAARRRMLAL